MTQNYGPCYGALVRLKGCLDGSHLLPSYARALGIARWPTCSGSGLLVLLLERHGALPHVRLAELPVHVRVRLRSILHSNSGRTIEWSSTSGALSECSLLLRSCKALLLIWPLEYRLNVLCPIYDLIIDWEYTTFIEVLDRLRFAGSYLLAASQLVDIAILIASQTLSIWSPRLREDHALAHMSPPVVARDH